MATAAGGLADIVAEFGRPPGGGGGGGGPEPLKPGMGGGGGGGGGPGIVYYSDWYNTMSSMILRLENHGALPVLKSSGRLFKVLNVAASSTNQVLRIIYHL